MLPPAFGLSFLCSKLTTRLQDPSDRARSPLAYEFDAECATLSPLPPSAVFFASLVRTTFRFKRVQRFLVDALLRDECRGS